MCMVLVAIGITFLKLKKNRDLLIQDVSNDSRVEWNMDTQVTQVFEGNM